MTKLENIKMLSEYVQSMHGSCISYEKRGKYVDAVWYFLSKTERVNKRGYKQFIKSNPEYFVTYPFAKEAILHFLASRGIGYRNITVKRTTVSKLSLISIDERRKEIINGFVRWLQDNNDYSNNTISIYVLSAKLFYSYFDQFSQDNCRQFLSHLESSGLSAKTVNIRATALVKLGDYLHKPVILRRAKIPRTLHTDNVPTEKEYKEICEWIQLYRPEWLMAVKLMATTGCRVSELAQFTYDQVAHGSCVLKGKGNKCRQFFFNKEMQRMATGKEGKILAITSRGLCERLKYIGGKLGIDKVKMHPHAFRHFFAKMYLKKTKDVVGLADLLGHGSVDTTRIYLQKSYDEQQKDFNRTVEW